MAPNRVSNRNGLDIVDSTDGSIRASDLKIHHSRVGAKTEKIGAGLIEDESSMDFVQSGKKTYK